MPFNSEVELGGRQLGKSDDTYIIAEIGSNFDGSIERAKKLIDLAADCGADAAKFQAFRADSIVSQTGFDGLKAGFQEKWEKPVYEVYRDAELPRDWLEELSDQAERRDVDFLCTPYDVDAVDRLAEVGVPAYKVGSGDITFHRLLEHIAAQEKPVILATGASTLGEVEEAVDVIQETGNEDLILLQCVTNYPSEFESANVRAMTTLAEAFGVPVGYSDHTPGSTVPLGAVSQGACVIEKHFTDDKSREGPDHGFAMNVEEFSRMVSGIRDLNHALGSPRKRIYREEETPAVLQRRCLRATRDIEVGERIGERDVTALRPAPDDSIAPPDLSLVVGREAAAPIGAGEHFTWTKL